MEWLKFDASTPEKREVLEITTIMGWEDVDTTVGKLLRIWRWFDQQTINGNAPNVTLALLDRIAGVSGFTKAMVDVGWLTLYDGGISLPHFDRHNGKTAKDRALTAKRVANHKAGTRMDTGDNDKGNDDSVTGALPRKEKKRKEKNLKTIPEDTDFETAWQLYPDRPGKSKANSLKKWQARIAEGVTAEDLIAGVKRYAEYVSKVGTDPQFIKQPETFFGPGLHYLADWTFKAPTGGNGNKQADLEQRNRDAAAAFLAEDTRGGHA